MLDVYLIASLYALIPAVPAPMMMMSYISSPHLIILQEISIKDLIAIYKKYSYKECRQIIFFQYITSIRLKSFVDLSTFRVKAIKVFLGQNLY